MYIPRSKMGISRLIALFQKLAVEKEVVALIRMPKSAKGGPYPLAGFGPGGVQICSDTGI